MFVVLQKFSGVVNIWHDRYKATRPHSLSVSLAYTNSCLGTYRYRAPIWIIIYSNLSSQSQLFIKCWKIVFTVYSVYILGSSIYPIRRILVLASSLSWVMTFPTTFTFEIFLALILFLSKKWMPKYVLNSSQMHWQNLNPSKDSWSGIEFSRNFKIEVFLSFTVFSQIRC